MVHLMIVELEREILERVGLGHGEETGFLHLVEHGVAAVAGTFLMAERIEIARILEHPDKHGGFLGLEVARLFAEIYVCRCFNSDGIVEEVETVEIHVDDLVFGVEPLELHGDHPFDRFLDCALEDVGRWLGIELFCKLLGDCRGTSG